MNRFLFSIFALFLSGITFAAPVCRETSIESQVEVVCFPEGKVCKYYNYHNMAPTLTYDCWSPADKDKNANNRIGCSNGDAGWPECAEGFILN